MSTNKRGNKSKIERPVVKAEIVSKVENTEENLMTEEEIVAQEEFINETPVPAEEPVQDEIDTKIEETVAELQELPDVIQPESTIELEKEKLEEVKENVFAFQKDYFLVNDGKSPEIDVLPAEQPVAVAPQIAEPVKIQLPKRKTLAQLSACELNIYHKTGILPLC